MIEIALHRPTTIFIGLILMVGGTLGLVGTCNMSPDEHVCITEHVYVQPSVVVDEPAIGDASEGFEGDGLVGIDPVYCWVTHYGPPRFTADDTTAWLVSIRVCLELVDHYADEWGVAIDGFCAVSPGMPWYLRVRDLVPALIYVEGHGRYLVLDRKGFHDAYGVDVYEPEQDGYMYCERNVRVWEVDTND